jgi:hypothetical protein
MARDANLVLQSSVTKTADFTGDVNLSFPDVARGKSMYARVTASNISCASGSAILQWVLDVSYTGASSGMQTALFKSPEVTMTTTAVAKDVFIPFEVSRTAVNTQVLLRVSLDYGSSSGSGFTTTYVADVVAGRPG